LPVCDGPEYRRPPIPIWRTRSWTLSSRRGICLSSTKGVSRKRLVASFEFSQSERRDQGCHPLQWPSRRLAIAAAATLTGRTDRVFDAYVNIGSLETQIRVLIQRYPRAKYIVMDDVDKSADRNNHAILTALEGASPLRLRRERTSTWRDLCEYLKLAPPNAQYPSVNDIGLRTRQRVPPGSQMVAPARRLRHDPSPWIAKLRMDWSGISASALEGQESLGALRVCNQGRDRYEHPLLRIRCDWRIASPRFRRAPTRCPQPAFLPSWHHMRLSVCCSPVVRGVLENVPHRLAGPDALTGRSQFTGLLKPTAHFGQATAIPSGAARMALPNRPANCCTISRQDDPKRACSENETGIQIAHLPCGNFRK
jgi:hypothetical protein